MIEDHVNHLDTANYYGRTKIATLHKIHYYYYMVSILFFKKMNAPKITGIVIIDMLVACSTF